MTDVFKILAYNSSSISCFICGAVCAIKNIDEWGWFLFIGVLLAAIPSSKK